MARQLSLAISTLRGIYKSFSDLFAVDQWMVAKPVPVVVKRMRNRR